MKNEILKRALINAIATALYIAVISSFLFYATKSFGPDKETVLVPIVMLLLFVFSAAITGALVFGQPVIWYLDGKKREALYLLVCTLGIILAIIVAVLLALYLSA